MATKTMTSNSSSPGESGDQPAPHLPGIKGPGDLRPLSDDELVRLAEEIRQKLITTLSETGGHLGPNLGVVELSIALCFRRHRNPKGAASIPSTAPSRPALP